MPGAVNNEDFNVIDVSKGVYVTNPLSVPDGYAYEMNNFVIKAGVATQRVPIRNISFEDVSTANGWYDNNPVSLPLQEINLPVASGSMLAGFIASTPTGIRP